MANCSAHIAAATANKSMYNSCQRVKRFEKPKNFGKKKIQRSWWIGGSSQESSNIVFFFPMFFLFFIFSMRPLPKEFPDIVFCFFQYLFEFSLRGPPQRVSECLFFLSTIVFFNICWIFSKGPSPKSFWMFVSLLVFFSMLNQCLMIATIQKKGTFFICKIKEKHCKYQWIIGKYGFWGGGTYIYVYIYIHAIYTSRCDVRNYNKIICHDGDHWK